MTAILDPIAAFLNGKGKAPPLELLRQRRAEAVATLTAARAGHRTASLKAHSGDDEARTALEAARRAVREAEDAIAEVDLAEQEARSIAEARERDARNAERRRRWQETMKHAQARQVALDNIQKYLGWLSDALKEFDDANSKMARASPLSLLGHGIYRAAFAGPALVRNEIELRLMKAEIIRDKHPSLNWNGVRPISAVCAEANAYLDRLRREDEAAL